MILTRQEKEKQILDLYNQGKTYKEIAEIVRVSPRDIKPVLDKAIREREKELENSQEQHNRNTQNHQTQKAHVFSQAYRLFSDGKTPLEVSNELNLRQPRAMRYYIEYWKLVQLHDLSMAYEEIGEDIVHLPGLYREVRAADIGVEQAVILIKNAKK